MNKDIKALLAIYTILILVGWNIGLKYEVKKEEKKKIEAMKIAINLNKANNDYIEMLHSMNRYADEVDNELKHIYHTQQLIKDLRFSR